MGWSGGNSTRVFKVAMKLRLNLATRPQVNNRPFLAGAATVGTIAIVALLLLSRASYTSWQADRSVRVDTARWEAQIRYDQQRHQALQTYFASPAAKRILDRSAFLNSLIDARSFPWTKIFTDLGQVLPAGVRVVSISPHLENGRAQLALKVSAATDSSKLQFLDAIQRSKAFSGLLVQDEKRASGPSATESILLDLTVWYSTT
jgi:type IV pilus assembly protein PilN